MPMSKAIEAYYRIAEPMDGFDGEKDAFERGYEEGEKAGRDSLREEVVAKCENFIQDAPNTNDIEDGWITGLQVLVKWLKGRA